MTPIEMPRRRPPVHECGSGLTSKRLGSPPSILRRVPYPVEPFDFELPLRELPSPLLKGEPCGFWKQPGLFEQVDDGQAYELKYVHEFSSSMELVSA